MRRITAVLALSVPVVIAAGCSFAMRPVRVDATAGDWERLSGSWRGQYTLQDQDRHGVIEFKLDGREREASGDVLMIAPSRWPVTGMPSSDRAQRQPRSATQLLSIRFVAADHGLVRGDLEPYWDPDRECLALTAFFGSVDGDVIAGSFVSICEDGVRTLRGRWRVERGGHAHAAAGDAIAQRRPLDVQQLRRLRLVAAARLERPRDQVRLDLVQPVVERHRRGRARRRWWRGGASSRKSLGRRRTEQDAGGDAAGAAPCRRCRAGRPARRRSRAPARCPATSSA